MNAASREIVPMTQSRFRPFEVVRKTAENRLITSFVLRPLDRADWRRFEPGQFLVFRLPNGKDGHVLRHYSISSNPSEVGTYRITVKREAAPNAGLPDGTGSGYLHEKIDVGSVLEVAGPSGEFKLESGSNRPIVLLSGGVGITPMMSMLHAASADPDRKIFFIHACRDGSLHTLPDEIGRIAQRRPGIVVHTIYQDPSDADRAAKRHQSDGFVTRELLQKLLPLDDYDFYLCGPSPFMQAVFATLRGLGVARNRIAYEFFGPATILDPEVSPQLSNRHSGAIVDSAVANPMTAMPVVTFVRAGIKAAWTPSHSLLDFAEANGLTPEFSCRAGVCGTCRTKLVAGEVEYFEEPLDPPGPGEVLLCCSRPRSAVTLDL
jgi:ferredoxin-NADP reductase